MTSYHMSTSAKHPFLRQLPENITTQLSLHRNQKFLLHTSVFQMILWIKLNSTTTNCSLWIIYKHSFIEFYIKFSNCLEITSNILLPQLLEIEQLLVMEHFELKYPWDLIPSMFEWFIVFLKLRRPCVPPPMTYFFHCLIFFIVLILFQHTMRLKYAISDLWVIPECKLFLKVFFFLFFKKVSLRTGRTLGWIVI